MVLFPRAHSRVLTMFGNQTYLHALCMAYARFTPSKLHICHIKVLPMSNRLGIFRYEYFGTLGIDRMPVLRLASPAGLWDPTR